MLIEKEKVKNAERQNAKVVQKAMRRKMIKMLGKPAFRQVKE